MNPAEVLFDLYGGLERAYGKNQLTNKTDPNGKAQSKNQTIQAPYTITLWDAHLKGVEGLGVIPITDEAKCNWGAIDVDIYPLDLIDLEEKVKKLKIPAVVLRTKSGGAHITTYFKEMQSCKEVRNRMAELSFVLGLGEREIYPKQVRLASTQDVGNWLNMPYFNALNGETVRYAVIDGEEATLEQFLAYAECIRLESVEDLVIPIISTDMEDGPPCLQRIINSKAGPGERNNVLFNMGVYSRLKHDTDWEKELELCNHKYLTKPLPHKEVGAIIKSLEKKSYTYTCNNVPLSNHCNKEVCKGREFGITAFEHVDVGILVDNVTKLTSEPPIWIISIEGVRSEVETEELLDQTRFRKVCVNAVNKIPGRMKSDDWDKFIRTKLSDIEIIEAPKETKISETVTTLLPQYLGSVPEGFTSRDMGMGRWMRNGSGYLMKGEAYLNYLNRMNIKVDPRKMWVALMNIGVTVDNGGVWHIPLTVFDPSKQDKMSRPMRVDKDENF